MFRLKVGKNGIIKVQELDFNFLDFINKYFYEIKLGFPIGILLRRIVPALCGIGGISGLVGARKETPS